MPPLEAGLKDFNTVSAIRRDMIAAKEQAAAHFAHVILAEHEPVPVKGITRILGKLAGRQTPQPPRFPIDIAPKAYYESDDGSSETVAILHRVTPNTACLFTREVVSRDSTTGEPKLGPLEPRAVIVNEAGQETYPPVTPLDKAGHPVSPETMTFADREAFVSDIAETLTIIHATN